jgi:DNA-binding NarL/FixJ family response regulator
MAAAALGVLVVDDDVALCEALERLLRGARIPVHVAHDAEAGLRILEREDGEHVGVVISDHSMPGIDGAELLRIVRERWPRMARILLTGAADLAAAARAVNQAQVARLLVKPYAADELLQLVKDLLRARTGQTGPSAFTPREREVLRCLARGASNAEIARHMHVTPGSARIYVNRILAKLGLPDRTKAALYAREHGLADV